MNSKALREAYKKFFVDTEAGQNFMKELDRLITDNHHKAEDTPELSRDYVQRAKGNREIKQHIDSVLTEVKKKK